MSGAGDNRLSVASDEFEKLQTGIVSAGDGAAAMRSLIDGEDGAKTQEDRARAFVIEHLCADLEALRVTVNRMAMGVES